MHVCMKGLVCMQDSDVVAEGERVMAGQVNSSSAIIIENLVKVNVYACIHERIGQPVNI